VEGLRDQAAADSVRHHLVPRGSAGKNPGFGLGWSQAINVKIMIPSLAQVY
jgi:hypothetical protein